MGLDEFPLFSFSGCEEMTQNTLSKEVVHLNLHSSIFSHGLANLIFTSPCELERADINNFILR